MRLTNSQEFNLSASADPIASFVLQNRSAIVDAAGDHEKTLIFLQENWGKIPAELRLAVENFVSGREPIFLLKGLNFVSEGKDIPATPNSRSVISDELKAELLVEPTMMLINAMLGVNPQRLKDGTFFISHIIPEGEENTNPTLATGTPLPYHADGRYQEVAPQVTATACLRGQDDAETYYLRIEDVLAELDEETIHILSQPLFTVPGDVDLSPDGPHGFLGGLIDTPYAVLDNGRIRLWEKTVALPNRPEAAAALEALAKAAANIDPIKVTLEQGDMIFWRNDQMIHYRTSYQYRDNNKRWLLRQVGNFFPEPHLQ